ncbi:uncharacterized protein LOC106140596 [Amyelois transitella]|uniref:uncharacterized protein LOC106140596 n=1 Tax=Amyelois transitella TaxID=680683 RepID=UPI00299045DA|nr:uncharacterized protein LOC106140596 [Amyelois transitella]
MSSLYVCLCLCGIYGASATHASENGFYYTKQMSIYRRYTEEECRVCFKHDCIPLETPKCQFYMAGSTLLNLPEEEDKSPPNNLLLSKVDAMMYNIIEKNEDYQNMDCIPMISTYTDCNKENLCTGCVTCTCVEGRWVCGTEECREETLFSNKKITVAIASLKSEISTNEQSRTKRSAADVTGNNVETRVTFEELSQWLNDTRIHDEAEEMDYLAFDEVLSNIALDNNNISRKKPIPETVESGYVSFVDIVSTGNNTDEHTNMYNENGELYARYSDDKDSFKVDLLKGIKDKLQEELDKNYTGIGTESNNFFESNNYLDEVNSLSIVKRDVSKVNESKIDNIADKNKQTIQDFKNNVLYPMISIVNDKENELKQLLAVKTSLIELIKGMDSNFSLDQMVNNTENNKTLFSIYKLEIVPETRIAEDNLDTRRSGSHNIAEAFVKKLQRDVFEIIKDLKALKRSLRGNRLPRDLILLLHGMNNYLNSQTKLYIEKKSHFNNIRRTWTDDNSVKLKGMILEILELCDKEMTDHDSLSQLSHTTKRVLQRVINQNQIYDFASIGVKLSDPTFTLSEELKGISNKWPELTDILLNSSSPDKLYNLKLLHLMLTVDLNKIANILKLLNFAENRRAYLDTALSDQEITRIQNIFNDLNEKFKKNFQRELAKKLEKDIEPTTKRRSFLKQIKRLFRNSRKDIKSMLHEKVSKSEIVRELAKSKLNELAKQKMTQYEDTLKKWQNKLNVRIRRSAYDFRKQKNRINNILPSYLRGKVNPAIDESKKKNAKNRKGKLK